MWNRGWSIRRLLTGMSSTFKPLRASEYVFRVSLSWVVDGASWQKDLACSRGVVLKFLALPDTAKNVELSMAPMVLALNDSLFRVCFVMSIAA
jgi:hypothetical protein